MFQVYQTAKAQRGTRHLRVSCALFCCPAEVWLDWHGQLPAGQVAKVLLGLARKPLDERAVRALEEALEAVLSQDKTPREWASAWDKAVLVVEALPEPTLELVKESLKEGAWAGGFLASHRLESKKEAEELAHAQKAEVVFDGHGWRVFAQALLDLTERMDYILSKERRD